LQNPRSRFPAHHHLVSVVEAQIQDAPFDLEHAAGGFDLLRPVGGGGIRSEVVDEVRGQKDLVLLHVVSRVHALQAGQDPRAPWPRRPPGRTGPEAASRNARSSHGRSPQPRGIDVTSAQSSSCAGMLLTPPALEAACRAGGDGELTSVLAAWLRKDTPDSGKEKQHRAAMRPRIRSGRGARGRLRRRRGALGGLVRPAPAPPERPGRETKTDDMDLWQAKPRERAKRRQPPKERSVQRKSGSGSSSSTRPSRNTTPHPGQGPVCHPSHKTAPSPTLNLIPKLLEPGRPLRPDGIDHDEPVEILELAQQIDAKKASLEYSTPPHPSRGAGGFQVHRAWRGRAARSRCSTATPRWSGPVLGPPAAPRSRPDRSRRLRQLAADPSTRVRPQRLAAATGSRVYPSRSGGPGMCRAGPGASLRERASAFAPAG